MQFPKTLCTALFSTCAALTITTGALAVEGVSPTLLVTPTPVSMPSVETASFDPGTNVLTLPFVKLNNSARYQSVVVQLLDMGKLLLNDSSVGDMIEYTTTGNILRLPQVTVGTTTYPRISLTNPQFALLSVGNLVVDAGTAGKYTLDVVVTVMGAATPVVTVTNVPKPATQEAFCNAPEMREQITQSTQGLTGSWTLNSCSFNGTTGTIAMTLVTPFMTLPYSAQYTYR